MSKVSIIIPAYNVEQYLEESVNSAVNQTMKDIEILIVDDASTDNTLAMAKAFAQEDNRIRVIENEANMGILASRFKALQIASGEYVLFLDADDRLVSNACELLVGKMEKNSFDLVSFNVAIDDKEVENPDYERQGLVNYLKNPKGFFPPKKGGALDLVAEQKLPYNVWNKMYRRDILQKALSQYNYERIQMSEDFLLTVMVLSYVTKFGVVDQALYVYRIGSGMSTASSLSDSAVDDYALIARVLYLLKRWIPNTEIDDYQKQKILDYSEKKIHSDIFYVFTSKIPDRNKRSFLNKVSEYWSIPDFVKEFTDYIHSKDIPNEEALEMMRLSLPEPRITNKTIGMFYNRMYNGGVERVISLLTPILMNAGYDVVILTEVGPTGEDFSLPNGVKHIKISSAAGVNSSRVEEWQRILKKYNIDTVIYHAWVGRKIAIDSMAIRSMNVQLILYAHGSFQYVFRLPEYSAENYFRQKKVYTLFSKVAVLSEVDRSWAEAIGLNAYTVLNPLTFDKENVKVSDLSSKTALWVGRLSAEKQYYDAFDIAAEVHKAIPDFKLRVVGKSEQKVDFEKVEDYLSTKDMVEYVLLEGEQSNVSKYYQDASVFLMTSEFEGFPMVLQEAKVFGLPIVSYELPNVTLLRQPDSGVSVIPQRDIKAAADSIVRLMNDESLRKEEGRKSRDCVDSLYDERNLEVIWKNIIEDPQIISDNVPAYMDLPINTAIRIAMENIAFGFDNAMKFKDGKSAQAYFQDILYLQERINYDGELNERIEAYRMEIAQLKKQSAEDRQRLNAAYESKTYRAGKAILSPLRFIKIIFDALLKRRVK